MCLKSLNQKWENLPIIVDSSLAKVGSLKIKLGSYSNNLGLSKTEQCSSKNNLGYPGQN